MTAQIEMAGIKLEMRRIKWMLAIVIVCVALLVAKAFVH
jgi:hypothetical protein